MTKHDRQPVLLRQALQFFVEQVAEVLRVRWLGGSTLEPRVFFLEPAGAGISLAQLAGGSNSNAVQPIAQLVWAINGGSAAHQHHESSLKSIFRVCSVAQPAAANAPYHPRVASN